MSLMRLGLPFMAAMLVSPFMSSGCVSTERPRLEAAARKIIPVPVCTKQLTPAGRPAGGAPVIRSLDTETWLEALVPGFDPKRGLSPTDVDCTGQYVFANETLRHGISKTGWPRVIDPADLDIKAGPRGLRVLRLRALTFDNGDIGGPIALVRGIDDRAEVYAVGSYRGPENAKLTPVRMGNETLVVVEAKRCPDDYNCRKVGHFFLSRRGRLLDSAVIDLERIQRMPSVTERGLYAEYRMSTDVSYKRGGIELLERVRVRIIPYEKQGDRDSDRLLRTVEFSRLLQVERDSLFATNESVWERVVGRD